MENENENENVSSTEEEEQESQSYPDQVLMVEVENVKHQTFKTTEEVKVGILMLVVL